MDSRVSRLAEIVVDHATAIRPGDQVLVQGPPHAQPLFEEIVRLVARRGAVPIPLMTTESLQRIFLQEASLETLSKPSRIQVAAFEQADVLINILSPENTRELSLVAPERMAAVQGGQRDISRRIMAGEVRWSIVPYPSAAMALEAGMDLEAYADFSFGATNRDWPKELTLMERVKEVFDTVDVVRVVASGTDITLRIGGRPGVISGATHNVPGGEVFYAPLEDATEGEILYDMPAIYAGRVVDGIRLRFAAGKVVEASATQGEDLLLTLLDQDEGSRILGELGIGTNYGIDRFTHNILFDEKIGGSIHLALGAAYPACEGKNVSAIHWDMIRDLRGGGELYADGRLVQKDGKFLF
ncbi:MAG: aminopeptidase [Thermaerobacter sp.]|nr:aminopeptidase [Thermaerobacter sp.]